MFDPLATKKLGISVIVSMFEAFLRGLCCAISRCQKDGGMMSNGSSSGDMIVTSRPGDVIDEITPGELRRPGDTTVHEILTFGVN